MRLPSAILHRSLCILSLVLTKSMTSVSCMLSLRSSPQTSTRSLMSITTLFLSPTSVIVQLALAFKVLLMHSPFCDYLLSQMVLVSLTIRSLKLYIMALKTSCELSERDGMYETYKGSPASQGELQYDLQGVTPTNLWYWKELKVKIASHSLRTLCFYHLC